MPDILTSTTRSNNVKECILPPCICPDFCDSETSCDAHVIKLSLHKDKRGYVGACGECLVCKAEAGEKCDDTRRY